MPKASRNAESHSGEKDQTPEAKWTPALCFLKDNHLAIIKNPGVSH